MACYVLYYYIDSFVKRVLRYLFFTIPQALPDEKQRELVSRELWVDANVVQYVAEQEDEMKTKMATSSKYKMYRSVVEVDRQPRSQALPPSAK